jgi:hypothetical protein
MENIRALESQLLRNQVTKLCLDQSALLAAKILIELRDDLLVGEVCEGEKTSAITQNRPTSIT